MLLPPKAVRVFVSYSHEGPEHGRRVEELAKGLLRAKFSVMFDGWVKPPPSIWSDRIEQELSRADVMLCVCTPTYCEIADGDVPGAPGRGVALEAALRRASAYGDKMRGDGFWAVGLEGAEVVVPRFMGGAGAQVFSWPEHRDELFEALRAPTKRRRVLEALREEFKGNVDELTEWAKSFVPLGRHRVLDFDRRARRVAEGLLTHRDGEKTKTALRELVARREELRASLDEVARGLVLGELDSGSSGGAVPSKQSTTRALDEKIHALVRERDVRMAAGEDTSSIIEEIKELRRRRREGPVLSPGEYLGNDERFILKEVIGRGGFATVWKAWDRTARTDVAIKVLHGHFARDEVRRDRLFRGSRTMAGLTHPNVVQVLVPHGEDHGFHYYVMEFVAGGDLHRAVLEGRVDAERGIQIIESIAMALHEAHGRGLVHRDVKPQNILLHRDGRPVLTDFDLVQAKDTTGGTRTAAMGSFVYAAPEQHEDASTVDLRADVYSLGMTAAFCVHGGKLPKSAMFDRKAFFDGLPCSGGMREVLATAAAVEVADRFPDMAAFVDGLKTGAEPSSRVEVSSPASIFSRPGGIELVRIPAGKFLMGSADDDELAYARETPQHEVVLSEFFLAKTPVTNAQYRVFLNDPNRIANVAVPQYWNDERFNQDEQPVVGVSWHEAKAYCDWAGLSLPTEAQWEYACRAGAKTRYSSGNGEEDLARVGWYLDNSEGRLHPVGQLEPNTWGLFDMHGNSYDWCADQYVSYETSLRPGDGLRKEPVGVAYRVIRGGVFRGLARSARSAYRNGGEAGGRSHDLGFRPAQGHPFQT